MKSHSLGEIFPLHYCEMTQCYLEPDKLNPHCQMLQIILHSLKTKTNFFRFYQQRVLGVSHTRHRECIHMYYMYTMYTLYVKTGILACLDYFSTADCRADQSTVLHRWIVQRLQRLQDKTGKTGLPGLCFTPGCREELTRAELLRVEKIFLVVVLHTVCKIAGHNRVDNSCLSLQAAVKSRVDQRRQFSVYHIECCCRTKQSRPAYLPVTAGCLRRICLRKKPTLSPAAGFTIWNYFRLGSQVRLLHFLETF